jgi:hypothetical protein
MLDPVAVLLLWLAHLVLSIDMHGQRGTPRDCRGRSVTHAGDSRRRGRSGAERMAAYRARHGDKLRAKHRAYMRDYRRRQKLAAAALTAAAPLPATASGVRSHG